MRYDALIFVSPFALNIHSLNKNSQNIKTCLKQHGKFSKYFSTFGFPNSETPRPNIPIECPLERSSLLYVYAKNQLDCLISSTSYVMDNAHLCLGRTKKKQTNKKNKNETRPVFCKQNSTSRLIFESDL